jgi:hypothetical protein
VTVAFLSSHHLTQLFRNLELLIQGEAANMTYEAHHFSTSHYLAKLRQGVVKPPWSGNSHGLGLVAFPGRLLLLTAEMQQIRAVYPHRVATRFQRRQT